MIVTTDAIVLKSMKYRDSSKILTLYTRRFGKVSVIAKAARDRKNKFGSSLHPMSYVTTVMYWKEGRDLQLLSQCDVVVPFRKLTEDMEKMASGMATIELLNAVSHGEEENHRLFSLVVESLQAMNNATKSVVLALYMFEVRLLDIMGFKPNFRRCLRCEAAIDEPPPRGGKIAMQISGGGVFCSACTSKGLGLEEISFGALRILQRMQELPEIESITRVTVPATVAHEVSSVLRRYMQSHIEGLKKLKSEEVFAAIL